MEMCRFAVMGRRWRCDLQEWGEILKVSALVLLVLLLCIAAAARGVAITTSGSVVEWEKVFLRYFVILQRMWDHSECFNGKTRAQA